VVGGDERVVWVGGYTEAVKVAALAQAFNLPVANGGGWPHHNMHLIAGVANGWRVEFHLLMWVIGETIFRQPPKPVRGTVTLSERPGLGLEPEEGVLADSREE
jgi:L-rhamnonate dehydratase